MTREENTDVVEIDAIANEEWERDQHTPQAIESNLAALVKQSASASSGPTRKLDEGWEDPEQVKPRTTTNTLRRTDDAKRSKTMALPATVKPPSMPNTKSTSQGLLPVAAKTTPPKPTPVAKPALAKSSSPALTPVAKPAEAKAPALIPAKPAKAVDSKPPALTPDTKSATAKPVDNKTAAVETKPAPAKTSSPALKPVETASTKPVNKTSIPALKPVEKSVVDTKPLDKKTSSPVVAATESKPPATPTKTSSPALTAVASEPLVARAPTPPPMDLPAWPPKSAAQTDYDDWENPNATTSAGNRMPPRATSEDAISSFLKEDSIIIDLNAVANEAAVPRRPQSYPVIQTSEVNTTTSGVFDMPSPSAATVVLPLPAPPVSPEVATVALRPSSTWNTPLPQPLPGEPKAAPPVPSWPSAAGLDHGLAVPEPVKHEPTEAAAIKRPRLATVFASLQHRRNAVLIATGVSVLVLLVEFALPSGSAKPAKPSEPAIATHVAARAETPKPTQTPDVPAKHVAVAALDPVVRDHAKPAVPAPQPAKRRISRKRPVVVDYDKKPDPSPSADEALANARAAYANGNQHLFAGEAVAAITAYKKALADYPAYAAGYRGLGLAYTQQGDPSSALTAFKAYVKLAPGAKDMALIMKRITRLNAVVAIRR